MSEYHPSPESAFERGSILRSQRRVDDAITAFKEALALDPNHAASLTSLAICWSEKEGFGEQALDAAQRAVSVEPEDSFARTVLASIENAQAKDGQTGRIKQALETSEQAVGLDVENDVAHAVQASILMRLKKYPKAEMVARRALSINVDNTMATEVLSAALLMQKKDADNQGLIDYHLQRSPEDDSAHVSAGWQALMESKYEVANTHFLEALRLNPMNERARLGLVECYRARSKLYALQIKFTRFMMQFTEGKQTAILIGGFIFYRFAYGAVSKVSPMLGYLILGLWLTFALWSHLIRGLSTFLILFDRPARQALRRIEKTEGLAVGGAIALSVIALGVAGIFGAPAYAMLALALLFAGVCNAAAFVNSHYVGRYFYGIIAAVASGAALLFVLLLLFPLSAQLAGQMYLTCIYAGIAVSWGRALGLGFR